MICKDKGLNQDPKAALNAVLKLLARREYSLYELKLKLGRKFTSDAVDTALDQCVKAGWQSEERCAQMLVRHCVFALYGPQRLRLDAVKKKLSLDLVRDAAAEVDWDDLALQALQRKIKALENPDPELKPRLLAFLFRRGFCADSCMRAVSHYYPS